jgi:hypothetical protein
MNEPIRYRVVLDDPHVPGWIETGSDGLPITGRARPGEIVERLENVLGHEAFDVAATLAWLEAAHPAEDSGDLDSLLLGQSQKLEIVVRQRDAKESPTMPDASIVRAHL